MRITPTDSNDAYYALAFAEHWPGGTHSADYGTSNNGNYAHATDFVFIGNNWSANITYENGARFVGYALE